MSSLFHSPRRLPFAWFLLPVLIGLWIVPRLLILPPTAGPAVEAAIEAVRAGPSPGSGRLEVQGLPTIGDDPAGLLSNPEILAARARLQTAVEDRNEALALRASDVARRLELTEDDLIGLRLSGWLIPFQGTRAEQLRRLETDAAEQPWEALQALAIALESRLEEPPEGVDLEISGQRRDLTRLYREIDDALLAAETAVTEAVAAFGRDARAAATEATGPFRRRGQGLFLEILLASLIGATLREAIRHGETMPGMVVRLSVAPALAIGVLMSMAGSTWLPIDPLRGVSLSFLPMAFVLGYTTGGVLALMARMDRMFRDDTPLAARAYASTAAPAGRAVLRPVTEEGRAEAPGAGAEPSSSAEPRGLDSGLLRDRVRELAHEVMAATGDAERTERELPEDLTRPAPQTAPASASEQATPPSPAPAGAPQRDEQLPFARRRR